VSRRTVTWTLTSADGSRRVRKTVPVPGRRVTWATCPSTQTQPSLATQEPIFWLTPLTGQGDSGFVTSVTAEAYDVRFRSTVTGSA